MGFEISPLEELSAKRPAAANAAKSILFWLALCRESSTHCFCGAANVRHRLANAFPQWRGRSRPVEGSVKRWSHCDLLGRNLRKVCCELQALAGVR